MRGLAVLGCALAACSPSNPQTARSHTAPATERERPLQLEPCQWPGYDGEVLCGRFEVPENREAPHGRKLALRVAVLPATGPTSARAPDALVFLAGGGVLPATRYVPWFATQFEELRRRRDIVLVDQRGTGESNPLDCPAAPGEDEEPVQRGARCAEVLATRADLRQYTTPHAMDDLEALRAALGYPTLTLWGASYGTKAARVYLRRYPERVRAMILHGVVPLATSMWPAMIPNGEPVLDQLFAACAADADCRARYPDPRDALSRAVARLRGTPMRVTGHSGDEATVDEARFEAILHALLGSVRTAALLPALVYDVADGDGALLAQFAQPASSPVPLGVYLAIACNEDVRRITDADVEAAAAAAPSFDARAYLDRERALCAQWPLAPLPREYFAEVASDQVPVLVLSGALDPVTPPAYGERIAAELSRATHVIIPRASHNDAGPCIAAIVQQFVENATTAGLDLECLESRPPLRFSPTP